MKAVHFGAGNIGRGFIGEVLSKNGFHIDFVDVNESLTSELERRGTYRIELAGTDKKIFTVEDVSAINSRLSPEAVIDAIAEADIVTTAIGPNILPFIAELIAKGLAARAAGNHGALDIIACENMIGGSQFLLKEVKKHIPDEKVLRFIEDYAGFPNAAVDRIVPVQNHGDILKVTVEDFKEWVVDDSARKNKAVNLEGVEYVPNLLPYIERKLFSVNTGHASLGYLGLEKSFKKVREAACDSEITGKLRAVLVETSALLIAKWGFNEAAHKKYVETIINRFANPHIDDDLSRAARSPIRKLGRDERFVRPIRELRERGLPYKALFSIVGLILNTTIPGDSESEELQKLLKNHTILEVLGKLAVSMTEVTFA